MRCASPHLRRRGPVVGSAAESIFGGLPGALRELDLGHAVAHPKLGDTPSEVAEDTPRFESAHARRSTRRGAR